jgi:drug/metabolite transporter (DMT)-like permease
LTTLALALVLASAMLHATWNLFAKRAGGGAPFVWVADVLSVIVYAPVALAVLLVAKPELGWPEFVLIAGGGVLHSAYFLTLMRGYRQGDLSLVYPLARGTGPLLATIGAIMLFGEHPSIFALLGAFAIAAGAFLLTGGIKALRSSGSGLAVGYGLLTGVLIGAYTLWDKDALSSGKIPPVLLYYGASIGIVVLVGALLGGRRSDISREWREHRTEVLAVGLISPLSYILMLTALAFSPVSYVAPAREVSILLGALLGTRLLSEGHAVRRLAASSAMVLGVTALALG